MKALLLAILVSSTAFADKLPDCMDRQRASLPIDNAQVLIWKNSTANQFKARAHVRGVVTQIFPETNGHSHFEIRIGESQVETLEVVFSKSFGRLPTINFGADVEACGDYITSYEAAAGYPASPSGALIHWVHRSPRPEHHPSGFVAIDNVAYGN
jgi:hypothetical protein